MMKKMLWGWFAVVLLVGQAMPARAAEEAQPYIVLVGINKYQDKQILSRETWWRARSCSRRQSRSNSREQ